MFTNTRWGKTAVRWTPDRSVDRDDVKREQMKAMAHRARTVPKLAPRARIVLAGAEGTPYI